MYQYHVFSIKLHQIACEIKPQSQSLHVSQIIPIDFYKTLESFDSVDVGIFLFQLIS